MVLFDVGCVIIVNFMVECEDYVCEWFIFVFNVVFYINGVKFSWKLYRKVWVRVVVIVFGLIFIWVWEFVGYNFNMEYEL